MSDSLVVGGVTYTGVAGFEATDTSENTLTYIRPQGNLSITQNGNNIDVTQYASVSVSVSGGGGTLITKSITENGTYNASSDNADGYSSVTVTVPNAYTLTDVSNTTGTTAQITAGTGGGGGGSVTTKTGTFTGNGTTSVDISCEFEPDMIYIYGDLSGDPSYRGIISFTILKDKVLYLTVDGSTSSATETLLDAEHGISGYGSSSYPHASYSDGTLTVDAVADTSSTKFNTSITYNYTLIGLESEEPGIPIGVELVDYTKLSEDTAINSQGEAVSEQWYYTTDYTLVDPSMTFSYRACTWFYIGLYDENKDVVNAIYVYTDGTQDPNNTNFAEGTLSGAKLSGVSYVRLTAPGVGGNPNTMSLIRTA